MTPDVPLLVPEINPDHLGLLAVQRRERGWEGAIVTNPNCAAVVLVIPLAALRPFGIRKVAVTTFQAVSGAGYPGVPSLDILGNVIPYIGGDEEKKVETEPQKILGELAAGSHPAAPVHDERELQPGALDRRPSDLGERRVRAPAGARGDPGGPGRLLRPPPGARPPLGAEAADPLHGRRRTARSRARTPGWSAAWPPPSAGCASATSSTGSSPRSRHNVLRGAAGAALLNAEMMKSEGLLDPMIVMKFGGSSVDGAAAIERVAGIVRDRLPRQPVVVVSAMAKTTSRLLAAADAAAAGDRAGALAAFDEIETYHRRESHGVVPPAGRPALDAALDPFFNDLRTQLDELLATRALTPRAADAVAGVRRAAGEHHPRLRVHSTPASTPPGWTAGG